MLRRSVPALMAMLIAAAILWFIVVMVPTMIFQTLGDIYHFFYSDDDQTPHDETPLPAPHVIIEQNEDEPEDEDIEFYNYMSGDVYYEDDKNFVFPRINVK